MRIYERIIKRILDFSLSGLALVILSPVILITAVLVRLKLGTPIIFAQDRPGRNEKIFKMYKFRTMTNQTDAYGEMLPDEVRLTNFGKKLRSTSLDELPELINILKGDMSIVGPRPLLVRYLPYYKPHERKRHCVRPGLTGLAQVNGRNFLNWEERFALDIKYVENISFLMDLTIIWKTIQKVCKRQDIMEMDRDKNTIGFKNLDEQRREETTKLERN